jgi:hypothetical protein
LSNAIKKNKGVTGTVQVLFYEKITVLMKVISFTTLDSSAKVCQAKLGPYKKRVISRRTCAAALLGRAHQFAHETYSYI